MDANPAAETVTIDGNRLEHLVRAEDSYEAYQHGLASVGTEPPDAASRSADYCSGWRSCRDEYSVPLDEDPAREGPRASGGGVVTLSAARLTSLEQTERLAHSSVGLMRRMADETRGRMQAPSDADRGWQAYHLALSKAIVDAPNRVRLPPRAPAPPPPPVLPSPEPVDPKEQSFMGFLGIMAFLFGAPVAIKYLFDVPWETAGVLFSVGCGIAFLAHQRGLTGR